MSSLPAFDEATAITAARADSTGAHAAPQPLQQVVSNPHPNGVAARLHNGIADARQILRELTPILALITTPQAARLIEALARAVGAGVPDAEIEGFIAGLHGLAGKAEGLAAQGSGPQPQLPAVDPDRGM
jgi:hypothetical protein